ncbi:helix-turn-helix transcriptional regulator [Natronobacterium texcoconense]|uniref:Sugar-specific transcriptional regulator TrmB n=1 Tax=Natronobacterium texcoconense TaxID=1095778 RepID=A0A1H1FZX6_NATTX|nr:winged helix-turn-helix domain-containing protein [Natronobacterium texcoconense]SDR06126.1 Sugar-specific transcriptional regulator TrmB [Natronobacterium texcoconense]
MGCCTDGDLSHDSAREACSRAIHDAIKTALKDDVFGVLVDALPTLGKSRTVATIADDLSHLSAEEEVDITVLTYRKETRNQIEEWAEQAGLDSHQLPIFDDDCPTADGAFGEDWEDRVHDFRDRGIPPGRLHADPTYNLPCSEDQTCPYVEGWEECRKHRVLVGHPTHAYVPEVIRDRIVVFDEDPGEAFRTDFDANDIHRIISEYLSDTDEITWETDEGEKPVESVDQLKSFRTFGPKEQVEETIENLRTAELFGDPTLVGRIGGHGLARTVTLSVLETERQEMGSGAERIELPDGAVAVYDSVDGRLYVRRPPDLSTAAAVIGLDGTPIDRIWEGRLGCPADQRLRHERVLCDDCRSRYLRDVLGYRVYQTTTHVKPYASGRNVHSEKDLALIKAVYRETGQEPAVITTQAAERVLSQEWTHVQESAHYGNIKGTNRFEGDAVRIGMVIGSQHPGDHEIKRLAALNGDTLDLPEKRRDRGKNLTYAVESRPDEAEDPYLTHFREHQVVQGIFRFGRRDGATVFVHTGAVPDWILTEGPLDSENEVFRRVRSAGEREVIDVLEQGDALTAKEVVERVDIAKRTVYDRLEDLRDDGLVEKLDENRPYRWRLTDTNPDQGHVIDDRWYVDLPGKQASSAD